MDNLIKRINNLRPNKKQVDKNPDHWYSYVDALNDVIDIIKKPEK